ncbi:hypothetical protein WJX75_003255 [Coccomyxa subellipsoidea]|uniref:Sec20 C-terminal domain-containing protein n=1 Tax=Coccomyxa subellipsoidea TaxID=248742 RepID=A0ABR2YXM8_9CHLO
MTQLRARMRELELLADEQETVEEGEAVVAVVNRHKRKYQELQKDFREASLEVQRRATRAAVEDRKALLGSANPLQRAQQLKTQADLANSATDTTASLQRTRQLMVEELDHTSATLAALEVSSTTLKGAADEYGQQRGRIKQSHKLLGTMRRASLWDRLTLWGGAALFAAVVAFIVYKRLAYFVPAALVPNFGALVPGMPAFGLANLTSGLGHLWSPAPSPTAEVDVRRVEDDDPRMQQWQHWAGASRSAETGRGGGDKELGNVDAAYREGGSADEWPDPSEPSYIEPMVRYEEQLSAAASQPSQGAATAHPQYGGFDGMHGGAVVAPQNSSAASPAPAQAQDILGGKAEEAEIAHRHAAPHFAEEASVPKSVEAAVDAADEQPGAAELADEAAGEGPPPKPASEEELAQLDELVSATPGLETVTAPVSDEVDELPLLSEELQDEPAVSAARGGASDARTATEDDDGEVDPAAGGGVGIAEEESMVENGWENVTGHVGIGVQHRGKVEEPVIESRDGLTAGALFQRLSREGHQAALQGDSLQDSGAGSGDEALLDAGMDTLVMGDHASVDVPGVKVEGSVAKEAPGIDSTESFDESDVGSSIHNEL